MGTVSFLDGFIRELVFSHLQPPRFEDTLNSNLSMDKEEDYILYTTESGNITDYYDYSDDACHKTEVYQFGVIITSVFFSVVTLFSCVGNALVLWVLVKYENLKSLTNTFLLNLALSDLVFTFGLPFWAYYNFAGRWTFGEVTCKAISYVFFLGFYSSIIFLTTMTVHRYIAVVRPLSVILNRNRYHCVVTSIIIWILSFCAATPHVIYTTAVIDPNTEGHVHCDYQDINWKIVGTYQQNGFFLAAFITITFCYIQILERLLRPTAHTRRKTVKLILCIVVVFFIGWAPYNIAIFLNTLISFKIAPFNECIVSIAIDYVLYVSRLVAFSHCCLNPVFYVFMGIKFRNHLKKMLWNICRKVDQLPSRNSIYSNGDEISMF
ncbi:chemokine XC receptor 1-like [Hoplias malabaricus]|uniref:chemokine XC receptor 1-like n=1 Tax=Hoplias malabaricus TaxID=27720 RepID=UPI003463001F